MARKGKTMKILKRFIGFLCVLSLCLAIIVPVSASETGKAGQQNVISVGYNSVSVVMADGSLYAWGNGTYGLYTYRELSSPTKIMSGVESVFGWTATTDGYSGVPAVYTAILTKGGVLYVVGDTPFGTLHEPMKVLLDVASASAGENGLAILKKDGTFWIYSSDGSKKHIMDGVAAVSYCGATAAVVKTDGSLWMWGGNQYGQLGTGDTTARKAPVKVMDGVSTVSVCHTHTAAIKTDGSLWMWGDNSCGQLGTGMAHNTSVPDTGRDYSTGKSVTVQYSVQTVPVKVMDQVASVSVNGGTGYSTHAIKSDGSLWCWGNNREGQLGNGGSGTKNVSVAHIYSGAGVVYNDYTIQDIPVKVMDDVAAVSGNNSVTAIVKRDGTVWLAGNSHTEGDQYAKSFTKVLDGAAVPSASGKPTVGGFSDVTQDSYCADAVLWAINKAVTNGTSKYTFSPEASCTKAEILTFIWRAAGQPNPISSNPFRDVSNSDYYYKAALWAHEKGLVTGSSFVGNTPCTRSMAVTYLWKAVGSPTASPSNQFKDVHSGADYAQAVAWAISSGVTNGTGTNTFSPDAVCNRGQIVTFLYRCRNMNFVGLGNNVNPFETCAKNWVAYSQYGDERASLRITGVSGNHLTCDVSFYRLTGFQFTGAIDRNGHATLYDAESGVQGELAFDGLEMILILKDQPHFYSSPLFDQSLSEYLGELRFVFRQE